MNQCDEQPIKSRKKLNHEKKEYDFNQQVTKHGKKQITRHIVLFMCVSSSIQLYSNEREEFNSNSLSYCSSIIACSLTISSLSLYL